MARYQKFCSHDCRLKFWSRPLGECWIWQGKPSKHQRGRGQVTVDSKRWNLTHYVASLRGLTKEAHEVFLPHCGSRLCVNPDHMGTAERFTRVMKTRQFHHLSSEHAREIWNSPRENTVELARQYGVHPTTIRNIWKARTHQKDTGASPNDKKENPHGNDIDDVMRLVEAKTAVERGYREREAEANKDIGRLQHLLSETRSLVQKREEQLNIAQKQIAQLKAELQASQTRATQPRDALGTLMTKGVEEHDAENVRSSASARNVVGNR